MIFEDFSLQMLIRWEHKPNLMVCSTYLFIPYSISFDVTYKHTTVQKENNN